jgi:hypothetical protein
MHDHDSADDQWLPAAGVPWFVTIFGRDSLIVSLQNMIVNTGLARGALKKLGQFQAQAMDDYRDAEPGKILHELRFGELAHFHRVPHTPSYGTADATPLYLILLHEKSAAQARISIISGRNRKQRRTRWRSEVNSNCRYRFVEQSRQRQVSFATSGRTAKRYRPASSNSPRSANESQIWGILLRLPQKARVWAGTPIRDGVCGRSFSTLRTTRSRGHFGITEHSTAAASTEDLSRECHAVRTRSRYRSRKQPSSRQSMRSDHEVAKHGFHCAGDPVGR